MKEYSDIDVENEWQDASEIACEQCGLSGFLELLDGVHLETSLHFLTKRLSIAKGTPLFESNQLFHGIYAVKQGSFKGISSHNLSNEQISGFYLPGELIGLDSIQAGYYQSRVIALETSLVCKLPLTGLESLGSRLVAYQQQVINILSEQVRHDQRQALLVGKRSAEARLASFLLNLAERFAQRGLPSGTFRLPMLQNDIANYLGLSIETVSRTLRSFREQGVLQIQGKQLCILRPDTLRAFA